MVENHRPNNIFDKCKANRECRFSWRNVLFNMEKSKNYRFI